MKRYWAVLLAAAMLGGCRSSQPATNPFLRTTVPPPGAGPGMMVMPGEPMATPPVVTMPNTPPPVSQAVPVPGQPLIAPPPVAPKQEEFHPPGGSYLYHQSSNEHPPTGPTDAPSAVRLASAQESESSELEFKAVSSPSAVQQAAFRDDSIALSAGAAPRASSLSFQQPMESSRGDPPERVAAEAAASSSVRIVGAAVSEVPSNTSPQADAAVLRITAGEAEPARMPERGDAAGGGSSRIAIVTSGPVSSPSTAGNRVDSAVTQTAFRIVDKSDYAHAPDYGTLRGRLEYSQSSHQWKLRYIPIHGQADAYGGSVVLGNVASLKSYAPGDMVAVRGRLALQGESPDFSPGYQVEAIEPLAR